MTYSENLAQNYYKFNDLRVSKACKLRYSIPNTGKGTTRRAQNKKFANPPMTQMVVYSQPITLEIQNFGFFHVLYWHTIRKKIDRFQDGDLGSPWWFDPEWPYNAWQNQKFWISNVIGCEDTTIWVMWGSKIFDFVFVRVVRFPIFGIEYLSWEALDTLKSFNL